MDELHGDPGRRRPVPAASPREEAAAYHGPGFVWIHVESADDDELPLLDPAPTFPMSPPTPWSRPRPARAATGSSEGAILNLRGPATVETDDSDRLVSIRMWVAARARSIR